MLQSRQRRKDLRKKVREMLAETRSDPLPLDVLDLSSVPGLLGALNSLTVNMGIEYVQEAKSQFDLNHYQSHIQAYIKDHSIDLRDIPALIEDYRKDLIWRFIAAIFLAHVRLIDIWQVDNTIMVQKHEIDREGCEFSGTHQDADGFERSPSGAQAW